MGSSCDRDLTKEGEEDMGQNRALSAICSEDAVCRPGEGRVVVAASREALEEVGSPAPFGMGNRMKQL